MEIGTKKDLTVISEYKDYLREKVKVISDDTILLGFPFDGKQFPLEESDQINWSNVEGMPDSEFPITLTCLDNSQYSLTLANQSNFYLSALNGKYTALKVASDTNKIINDSTTISGLDAIRNTL